MGDQGRPGDEGHPDDAPVGESICPDCSGSGELDGQTCGNCNGSGVVEEGVGGA